MRLFSRTRSDHSTNDNQNAGSSHSTDEASSSNSRRGTNSDVFSALPPRRSGLPSAERSSSSDKDKTIAALNMQVGQLLSENTDLKAKLKNFLGSDTGAVIKRLESENARLASELTLARSQAQKFRQLDATEKPERAETEEETLYNVCNHPSMNRFFEMKDPRIVSTEGAQYLANDMPAGDSLGVVDIKKALTDAGRKLSDDKFEKLFPKNKLLVQLSHDVADGDKQIAVGHLECMVSMDQYCTGGGQDNIPHVAPDGTTASLAAFRGFASRQNGNASFDQGASQARRSANPDKANPKYFTLADITPNNAVKKISEVFNETWALPVQRIQRRDTLDPYKMSYAEIHSARVAQTEMNMQGFGSHKAQMCMIIDKESFDSSNAHDMDNASRISRQVALLATKLDDNGVLDVFSHQVGEPTRLNMRVAGNDINITRWMQKTDASPSAESHIMAMLNHFYPDDPGKTEYRRMPVFCTLLTKSLSKEKYTLLKNTASLFSEMKLPFFLKLVNVNPDLTEEEIDRMNKLDDSASVDNGMNFIDNVDVVAARDPSEITPKNFLREYAGFVAQAVKDDFLQPDQGFYTRKVDIRSEGRAVAGSLR